MKVFLSVMVVSLLFFCGCDSSNDVLNSIADDLSNSASPSSSSGTSSGTSSSSNSPIDLSQVVWLHTDVSGWSETSNLRSVTTNSSSITLDYDKANVWPKKHHTGTYLNGNPWIFVKQNGVWYAATWEWLKPGQITKNIKAVNGDHIKRAPLHNFKPKSGEEYGFMVSGMARDGVRNVKERTNIVMYTWP